MGKKKLMFFTLLFSSVAAVSMAGGSAPLVIFGNGSGSGQVGMLTENGKLHTGQMTGPAAFLSDAEGNLLVADTINHRIILAGKDGRVKKTILLAEVQKAAALPEMPMVSDIAIAGTTLLYLADLANLVILVVDLDKGYLRSFGKAGTGAGQFIQINRIRADGEGNAFIEDAAGQKTLVFRPDGQLLAEIPGVTNAAVDRNGDLYQPIFSGNGKMRTIDVFDRNGKAKGTLGKIQDPDEISFITCLGFDRDGNLHLEYATEKGLCLVTMGPDGKVVRSSRHAGFDPGLDVTTPIWITSEGRALTIDASAERLLVKELD